MESSSRRPTTPRLPGSWVGLRSYRPWLALVTLLACLALAWVVADYLGPRPYARPAAHAPAAGTSAPIGELLAVDFLGASESPAGFSRAIEPRPFVFPADHGPHRDFQSEWWYFTGNLAANDGRAFGFQLTFFRHAMRPAPAGRDEPSGGRAPEAQLARLPVPEVYLGHFAVSDLATETFHAFERFGRADIGTARARAIPLEVAIGGWSLRAVEAAEQAQRSGELTRLRLAAADVAAAVSGPGSGSGPVSIQLDLHTPSALVAQGEDGLSRKGPGRGESSFYYSIPRWQASGKLRVGDEHFEVEGHAWFDREWSTGSLGPNTRGWDWFALHLDDGTDLMLYQLRGADGTSTRWSAGTVSRPVGNTRRLAATDFELTVTDWWESPNGVRYPAGWTLAVAPGGAEGFELSIRPRMPGQLWRATVEYWEGAVSVTGTGPRGRLQGLGYAELVGYAGRGRR